MKKIALCIVLMMVLSVFSAYAASSSTESTALIKVTLLNQDPNPASAGDIVKLRFKIENYGGQEVKGATFEIVQDYPFTVASGDAAQLFDNLGAYQTGDNYVNLEYTIKIDKDATQGQHEIKLRYKYGSNEWAIVSFSVNIASKEFAQIIYIDKAKLDPGKETDMTFTITNIGNAPLQNLVFSWEEPKGAILPVYSSDSKYIKYLEPDQSVELKYKVIADVNAAPGLYQLNLNLVTESTTGTKSTITTKAGVFIGGETDFEVSFSESTQGTTSISVANTGNNPAQSVSVKIPDQDNFRVTGSNSAIIGNLDKGDYTMVSFQVSQKGIGGTPGQNGRTSTTQAQNMQALRNMTGRSNLKVNIDYTDTTGERRSIEKVVPIQLMSSTSAIGTTGTYGRNNTSSTGFFQKNMVVIIIIIVVLVISAFIILRKKPLRDKILGMFSKRKSK